MPRSIRHLLFEGGSLRRHVGRGQCELRAHYAASRHLAWRRRGDWRDAGCGHAGAAHAARAIRRAFQPRSGLWSMAGILVALVGIAIVSYAGHQKEKQMGTEVKEFNVMLGLALAVLCGIFSAGFSFGLDAATPCLDRSAGPGRRSALRAYAQLRADHGRRARL